MPRFPEVKNHIKNIGIISTRIAGTDGVSLEIAKWTEVLERNGYHCFFFAGLLDRPPEKSYLVEEAFFEHPEVVEINNDWVGKLVRKRRTTENVYKLKERLKKALYDFRNKYEIDLIIPENAVTIPMNIPLGIAITEFIAETGIPTIAHHHDFYWERDRYLINAGHDFLHMAFPPRLPSIQHVVINSIASEALSRRGVSNTIIPNVYNFAVEPPPPDAYCADLREKIGLDKDDLFVLQPTRVVPRKWIERSIEIVRYLNLPKPVLVISHASGDEGDLYFKRVKEYARSMGVQIVAIDHLIAPERGVNEKGEKLYTIADVYNCADLVTYPSGYEGFGNAFLEAIYYKKPIVVNRYSIFRADIEPKGFEVIVFEGFVSHDNIEQIWDLLNNREKLRQTVEKNYRIARRCFSFEVLEEKLLHLVHTFEK